MFKVDISPYGLGQHQVTLQPEDEDTIEFGNNEFSSVTAVLFLLIKRDQILIHLEASGTAHLICDRTLKPFEQEVTGQHSVMFAIPDTAKPADKTDEYEEVREWHPSDTVLDLTDIVRDTLVLALPHRRIAPGAEDEEIQTAFGVPDEEEEKSIDPRWAELQALKDSSDDHISSADQNQ